MKKILGMLAVMILSASLSFAQTTPDNANSDRGNNGAATTQNGDNNNQGGHNNWGWRGILGLAGLAGLRGRRQYGMERDREDRDVTNIRRAA